MHTNNYTAGDRFDAWIDLVSRSTVPIDVTTPDPDSYTGQITVAQFGETSVASVTSSSCTSRRTQRLINQSDPHAIQLMLVTRSTIGVAQNGSESTVGPGDIAFHTTWRPFTMRAVADESNLVTGVTALLPRSLLSLPTNSIEQTAAHTISGREGSGALLAALLIGLTKQPSTPGPEGSRLACALADLLAVSLSTMTGDPQSQYSETLVTRIRAFIQQHLGDPALNPLMIAQAHHLSTRSLHRLFEEHGDTISGYIRRTRVARCQRDLTDPALRHRTIQDIAHTWGFRSPTHFNHIFRTATGTTPGQYRQTHLDEHAERGE